MRIQSIADGHALVWDLLAWEDAHGTGDSPTPFSAKAPMLEGEWGIEAPPLAPLVADVGARLSGLRLADATLILKIENRSAAAQVRMRPGLVHTRPGLDSEVEMGPGPGLRLGFRSGQRQAIERLEELRNLARGPGPDAPHPADRELLTVLDGHLAGKPWRETAVDLYDRRGRGTSGGRALAAPQTALVGDRRTGRAAQSLGCKSMDSGGTGFVESATAHSMTKNGVRWAPIP